MKRALVIAMLAACRAPDPPPAIVTPALTAPVPDAGPLVLAGPKLPQHVIVLGGANRIENAAWLREGVAAVTKTDLWRFRPEDSTKVAMIPLARPLGRDGVITSAPASATIAIALDDGGVDLFRDGKRLRTLPGTPKRFPILDLRISPDGKTISVLRTSESWFEETAFHDIESGALRGTIAGGNVVFDSTSTWVAGRGGLFAVDGGKEIAKFKEGFYVQRIDGAMVDVSTIPRGQEVMAGDYVARGFFDGKAFFAGNKEIDVVDPRTGATTKIAASCAPSFKVGSVFDGARGRMIGLCLDSVLVTDLVQRTTKMMKGAVQRSRSWFPEVVFPPTGKSFLVDGLSLPTLFVDPDAPVAAVATDDQIRAHHLFTKRERCVRMGTPRVAIPCEEPAMRDDGAFRLRVIDGMTLTRTSPAGSVADWGMTPEAGVLHPYDPTAFSDPERGIALAWHDGAPEARTPKLRHLRYRAGTPLPSVDATEKFANDGSCGVYDSAYTHEMTDTYAAFKMNVSLPNSRFREVICQCSAKGCKRFDLPANTWFGAIAEDGTLLVHDIATTSERTIVRLVRAGKPIAQKTLDGSCSAAAFSADGRIFVACDANEHDAILELSKVDLAIVARRDAPPIGRVSSLARWGDAIAVIHSHGGGEIAAIVPVDWVSKPAMPENATFYAWPTFGILQRHDGKVRVAGDAAAAAIALRCYDGASLVPFETCAQDLRTTMLPAE